MRACAESGAIQLEFDLVAFGHLAANSNCFVFNVRHDVACRRGSLGPLFVANGATLSTEIGNQIVHSDNQGFGAPALVVYPVGCRFP